MRIECLGCGEARVADVGSAEAQVADPGSAEARVAYADGAEAHAVDPRPHPHRHRLDPGECPRCGYLGWAPSTALTEPMRRRIRERPVDRRAAIYAV